MEEALDLSFDRLLMMMKVKHDAIDTVLFFVYCCNIIRAYVTHDS